MIVSVDVTLSTHNLLKAGVTEARLPGSPHRHHRVVVEADTVADGLLLAAQLAHTTHGHAVVTGTYWRI